MAVGARVRTGRECRIQPHVTLRDDVVLGDRVIIHSGTAIGADGFGHARDGHRYEKIPKWDGADRGRCGDWGERVH